MKGDGKQTLTFGECPLPLGSYPQILLAHGSGGKLTHQLIGNIILPHFRNEFLELLLDGAIVPLQGARLAFTTDSYVVNPLFFPGGDIGSLAVNGTVNDLAMCGAKPLYLSSGIILEEGFAMNQFEQIIASMRRASDEAGVKLVTGDTKVVDRGKGDGIFINTSGIGLVPQGRNLSPRTVRAGDKVLISGAIAEHGIAIISAREGLEFESDIVSDTASLAGLVETMFAASPEIHVLRDPTRGGVATTLNELAFQAKMGWVIDEAAIPVAEDVKAACEILGFDPLYVANEGKLIAIVAASDADTVLDAMRMHPFGKHASVIGEVVNEHPGYVVMNTRIGGTRLVDMLSGEQLPRIC
jgi:hydrogenase expression/formation protein HypE